MLLIPLNVFALNGEVKSENLKEACESENINYYHTSYNLGIDPNKPTIYFFRGQGCPHCKELLNYFNDTLKENGKYFNLIVYEVWDDIDNKNLFSEVAKVFGDSARAVPYLVVGNERFIGFMPSQGNKITSEIKKLYNSDEKYDVMEHLGDENTLPEKKEMKSPIYIILLFSLCTVTIGFGAYYLIREHRKVFKRK